ncbi:hypothetical protein [Phenylobacterium sp.]|uniref:hypothetical protein n=1 Tax=Phenylobacterium sp. TaxID=1871053 RepID=UPI00273488B0|nr:hypothetical protein [Phenylobacterium sp.]MDP3635281.1 hypothetical protein [Phenylobacterium sp.]
MVRLTAAILALALCGLGQPAQASPLWGSDEIRRARPGIEAEALMLDVRTETIIPGKSPEVTLGVVTLAPSFTYIVGGNEHLLEDHALCRSLSWRSRDRTFSNDSCYAAVAFRRLELENRKLISALLTKAGSAAQGHDLLYRSETELGVHDSATALATAAKAADGIDYRLGDEVVARISGLAGPATPQEMRLVGRWLARYAKLHPQVRHDITAGAGVPARVESTVGPGSGETTRQIMTLSNLRRARVAYPLAGGLRSTLAVDASQGAMPRDVAVRRAQAVLAGAAPKPNAGAVADAMQKAASEGRPLEATLLFLELTQEQMEALKPDASGQNALLAKIRAVLTRKLLDTPDVAQLMTANALAGSADSPGNREAAARYLANAGKMDAMAFGTFRRVTYANLVRNSPDTEKWDAKIAASMPASLVDNYWIHIAAHPWSSNTFKDAGDSYLGGYDTPSAWAAFDLGRAVDPDWRAGPMAGLARYEAALRANEPDFF